MLQQFNEKNRDTGVIWGSGLVRLRKIEKGRCSVCIYPPLFPCLLPGLGQRLVHPLDDRQRGAQANALHRSVMVAHVKTEHLSFGFPISCEQLGAAAMIAVRTTAVLLLAIFVTVTIIHYSHLYTIFLEISTQSHPRLFHISRDSQCLLPHRFVPHWHGTTWW